MTDEAPLPAESRLDVAVHARRHGTGHPLAGFVPVLLWGLRESLTAKKMLVLLGLAVGLGALAALIVTQAEDFGGRDRVYALWEVLDEQLLLVILPLSALLLVGPMFSREERQRTLVYLLVRPVSRVTIFLARYAAGLIPAVLVALAVFYSALCFSDLDLGVSVWTGAAVTALFGVVVLGAVYYVLAALFQRGLIAGLVYTFVVEGLVGNLPGTIQKFSVRYHLRSLHHGLTDADFAERSQSVAREVALTAQGGEGLMPRVPFDQPGAAAITLLIVTGALLAFGAYRTATRDFALKD